MVNELENNVISGLLLVIGCLMAFVGFRNAFFVGVAIPLSMMASFLVLGWIGYTLNMMVLFSLILMLGMLVDNGGGDRREHLPAPGARRRGGRRPPTRPPSRWPARSSPPPSPPSARFHPC